MLKRKPGFYGIASTIIAILLIFPFGDLILQLFEKPNENWMEIKEFLLRDFIGNTLILVFFTALIAILIGTTLAWLISAYDFPLRKFFRWALILPLAIPSYILAYTYAAMASYTGVVQVTLRSILGTGLDQRYFNIMSMPGAVFVLSLSLMPYIYMILRAFMEGQSASLIESGRMLGKSHWGIFFKVVVPVSRIALVAGTSLVILEVLSDYGVASYFGIQTFSTAIFRSWFSLGDLDSAIRLAAILMVFVLLLLFLEKILRGRRSYSMSNSKHRPLARKKLKGTMAVMATSYAGIVLLLGFLIPVGQLIYWAVLTYKDTLGMEAWVLGLNTLWVAVISALIILIFGIMIANYARLKNNILSKIYSKISLLGYSIPGAVVAITMILFFIHLDRWLAPLYRIILPGAPALVLSMSLVLLVGAYVLRFLAVGFQSIDGGFERIGRKYHDASRMLGHGEASTFFKIDLPMLKPALLSGFSLVCIDIIKELPLALILRPFNFNTLATKVFDYANDERIPEASVHSLLIVLVVAIGIIILNKTLDKEKNNEYKN